MKYNDRHHRPKGNKSKFGQNQGTPQENWGRHSDRSHQRAENKIRRIFVRKVYDIDKFWLKTLTDDEMRELSRSWSRNIEIRRMRKKPDGSSFWFSGDEGDGDHESLSDFIKFKKPHYGNVGKARDFKIEELFQD